MGFFWKIFSHFFFSDYFHSAEYCLFSLFTFNPSIQPLRGCFCHVNASASVQALCIIDKTRVCIMHSAHTGDNPDHSHSHSLSLSHRSHGTSFKKKRPNLLHHIPSMISARQNLQLLNRQLQFLLFTLQRRTHFLTLRILCE